MAGFSKYSFLKYLYHNYNDYWYNENNLNFIDNDEITIFYIKSYGYYAFIIKSYDKVLTNMFKLNCNKITI